MMHEAPATPRRKSASSDELDYADANKYDDLEEAQALLDAESGEKTKKKAPPRNLFGFYLQYFAVGVVYGGLPSTIYGFFLGYLNVEGYVYATCATIVGLPWSFKFIFGAINDCFPTAPAVGDRVVLRLDDVEGVVRARGRPGWFLVDLDGYDSAIEFEASELRVLAPAGAAPGRFDQFAFREAVPESVGAMRSLIASAGLSSADCVEKSELRARSAFALERLAESND